MKKQFRLNGHGTICKSAKLAEEIKDQILAPTTPGMVKVIQTKLFDADGNEVVLRGKLKRSHRGSLTCSFNTVVHDYEIIEVPENEDEKPKSGENYIEQLGAELLG